MKLFLVFASVIAIIGVFPTSIAKADDTEKAIDAGSYKADHFAPCAACHLADGSGIPGAFPGIRNRAAAMAVLAGGRRYLISVVSYGLMGPITADGTAYAGVMPGHGGSMQIDAIADALNFLVFQLSDDFPAGLAAFTSFEVAAVQNETENASPTTAANMRKALVEQHGGEWPN